MGGAFLFGALRITRRKPAFLIAGALALALALMIGWGLVAWSPTMRMGGVGVVCAMMLLMGFVPAAILSVGVIYPGLLRIFSDSSFETSWGGFRETTFSLSGGRGKGIVAACVIISVLLMYGIGLLAGWWFLSEPIPERRIGIWWDMLLK
jgi:hypothetical protein